MNEEVRRRVMEHGGLVLYSGQLYDALWGDVAACETLLGLHDLPYVRRQLVRAAFALVEASTYYLKRIALSASKDGAETVHRGVETMLWDESYEVLSNGKVRVRNARIPTLANIRFSLNAAAVYVAPGYEPEWGEEGWDSLRKSLRVRDRLTHPKSLADLRVTDDELRKLRKALEWYRKTVAGVFKTAADLNLTHFNELIARGEGQALPAKGSPGTVATG